MKNFVSISKTIRPFNKDLIIEGDKSLSIRWALLASQASGKSKSLNLLKSEDVINTLRCLQKLGVKVKLFRNFCEITGNGLNNFIYAALLGLEVPKVEFLGRCIIFLILDSFVIRISLTSSLFI